MQRKQEHRQGGESDGFQPVGGCRLKGLQSKGPASMSQ